MLETITVYTLQATGAGFWLMAESSKNIYICLEYELLYLSRAETTYINWK